jgi:DHA1 family bicyclomycin/chloramphenicol resistance-like MFS transporter
MIYGALVTQSVIVVTLICSINKLLGLYETIAMLFLFLACLGISNLTLLDLHLRLYKNAGSASALMGAIQLGLGALLPLR